MEKEKKEGLLSDFQWEDGSGDFFGIPGSAVEAVEEPPKKEEKEEKPEEVEEEKKEDLEETFFGIDDKDTTTTTTVESPEGDDFYSTLYNEMKQKGILSMDLEEDAEVTEEKFFELQEQEIESRVDDVIDGFMNELDDDAKAFLKFKRDGGNTADFFSAYSKANTPNSDITTEAGQDKLLRHYYKNVEQMPDDEVEDMLEWLKENGKKSVYAERMQEKLQAVDKQMKDAVAKRATETKKLQEQNRKQFEQGVKDTLAEIESVGDFVFNKTDKAELPNYLIKPAVKVGKNRYVTQFQSDMQKALADKNKLLLIAKLIKNNFDVSDIKREVETEVTKNTKSNLRRAKEATKKGSSGRSGKGRGLADYF